MRGAGAPRQSGQGSGRPGQPGWPGWPAERLVLVGSAPSPYRPARSGAQATRPTHGGHWVGCPAVGAQPSDSSWWREGVLYQIYPRRLDGEVALDPWEGVVVSLSVATGAGLRPPGSGA